MLARSSSQDVVICTAVPDPWGTWKSPRTTRLCGPMPTSWPKPHSQPHAKTCPAAWRFTTPRFRPGQQPAASSMPRNGLQERGHDRGRLRNGTGRAHRSEQCRRPPAAQLPDPVAVAPRGFRAAGGKVKRVTLAFRGDTHSIAQVAAAETLATHCEADLRLAAFAVDVAATAGIRAHLVAEPILADWRAHLVPLPTTPCDQTRHRQY